MRNFLRLSDLSGSTTQIGYQVMFYLWGTEPGVKYWNITFHCYNQDCLKNVLLLSTTSISNQVCENQKNQRHPKLSLFDLNQTYEIVFTENCSFEMFPQLACFLLVLLFNRLWSNKCIEILKFGGERSIGE